MSEIKVNKISPATSTAITLGDSGDTFTLPSGATIVNSGTATGFGGGKVLQVVSVTKDGELSTSAGGVPTDITKGGELFTYDFTPTSASSNILVMTSTVAVSEESNGGNRGWLALWNGVVFVCANSGSALDSNFGGSHLVAHHSICHTFAAGSTSQRTISVRGGMDSGTNCYLNGSSSPNYTGSDAQCSMIIQEIGA